MRRLVTILSMALCTALAATLPVTTAQADWSSFYTPPERASAAPSAIPGAPVDPSGVCIREILKAQLRHQIPGNLLLGIGLQEAGMMHKGELTVWPWVANAEGEGRFFDNPGAAASWVRARQAGGVASIDVGCMQVNLRWHPDAFETLDHGLDPETNVDYAARLLLSLYERTGDWTEAAGRYHSATDEYKDIYLGRLRQNVAIANDRLDIFRELAARGTGHPGTFKTVSAPGAAPAAGGLFWTSDLSRSTTPADGARSLFGRGALQPVLPAFRKMF